MKLEAGDIIQVDGGNAIVTQVKGDRALIAAIGDLGGRSVHALKNGVELEITRNRLVERRGETGLAEFFAERNSNAKHERKGQIKTEPGDRLCYEGSICIVASVTGSKCEIAHPDGRTFTDDRWLNEFFFRDCSCHKLMRLTAEQREENLKEWQAAVKPESKKASAKASEKTPKPEKEAGKQSKPAKAESGKLFGSSICRVAMTAGANGVTYEQFIKVLSKHSLELSESTIKQNLRAGKSGKMQGPTLTKEQLAEFLN